MTYEVPLITQISEEGPRNSQAFAKLVGKRFLKQLASKGFSDAAKALEGLKGWVNAVKALRDPAAHRLPLRFITAVIPADRRAEYEDLKVRQAETLLRDDFDERRRLQEQERRLATFLPATASPAPDANGLRIIPNQILADQEQFVRVTNHVLSAVLDRPTAKPTAPDTA